MTDEERLEADFMYRARVRHMLERHVPTDDGVCKPCLIKQAVRDIHGVMIGRELEVPKEQP